jgi:type IV pilus assembly protein PilY1
VVFVSNVPNSNPCLPGTSHLFQFDLVSGSYVAGATDVSDRIGDTLATRPVLIKLPSGKIVALIRKSDGTTTAREVPTPPSGGSIRRLSWRELNYR